MKIAIVILIFIVFIGILILSRRQFLGNPQKSKDTGPTQEFSSNFDLSDIQPVMQLLSQRITSGFSESEVERIIVLAKRLKVDEEGNFDFEVSYNGKKGKLQIKIAMDDIESPDVYFFSNMPELIEMIKTSIRNYTEKLGR